MLGELVEIPGRVLAIFAHPDDMETACGATVAKWVFHGSKAVAVVAAQGEKGLEGVADQREAAKKRRAESLEAAEVLGIDKVHFLDIPDGEVENSRSLRGEIVGIVRAFKPDFVIAPDPTAVFFADRYVNHRDHRELGWAVLDAVFPAASLPAYFPDKGPPHGPRACLLSGSLEPNVFVDVANWLDQKVKAVLKHRSRAVEEGEVRALVYGRAVAQGEKVGRRAVETFRMIQG